MPIRPIDFDAASVDEQVLVTAGQVLNGITLLDVPAGVAPFIKFGNNPAVGPFVNPMPIDFGSDVDFADVSEGVKMFVLVAVPGARVTGFVSFRSANAGAPNSAQGL